MKICREKAPALTAVSPAAAVACHLANEEAGSVEAADLTGISETCRSILN
jgi:hypothetical protein